MKKTPYRPLMAMLGLAFMTTLFGCGGGDGGTSAEPPLGKAKPARFAPIELNIAHINDHHSQLDPTRNFTLSIDGVPTRVDLGGFPRVSAAFKAMEGRRNLLKLHAGDAITGTLYHTLFRGEADAALMNTVCFDAFVPGNHEFDDGDEGLRRFLDLLRSGPCKTAVVAANIQPAIGTPLAPATATDYLQPHTIRRLQGVDVALIGINIRGKTINSSRPLATTVFEDEVQAAQRTIDALKRKGIRHFVLLTHQGYEADIRMAGLLSDVDVIIGGDSHSLLGDFEAFGLAGSGPYPTQATNREGSKVCIGQAWEYAKAIGDMQVRFNGQGEVASCKGQASLLIGSGFQRQDAAGSWQPVDEVTRTRILSRLEGTNLKVIEPDPAAAAVLDGFSAQIEQRRTEVIGQAAQSLCLVRVPGESTNRSSGTAGCESANQLARGSDVAQVVAEAFLAASPTSDLAIQNAGGVRIPVPNGPLSLNTAFTLLPFTNVLVELELTGQQVLDVLEDAVSNHLDAGQSSGSHPYAAGLRWHLDMSRPRGQRFSQVQVFERSGGQWLNIEAGRNYRVATNDFIASGRDGYTTFGEVFDAGRYTNTYLLYTQTFVDYVRAAGTIERPAPERYAHQSVVTATGQSLP